MTEVADGIDWTGVSEPMARQIMTQGETFLQAQLQAALAADQRATTMSSVFVTLSTAIAAGGIAFGQSVADQGIVTGSLVCSFALLIAAGFGAWAARPIDFYFPGNQPSQWYQGRKVALSKMLGGEAENYEARIEYNNGELAANQAAIYRGFWVGLVSPLLGVLVWAICSFCPA
jgi:hypothetical protein